MKTMISKIAHIYDGVPLAAGQHFEAHDEFVDALQLLGRAGWRLLKAMSRSTRRAIWPQARSPIRTARRCRYGGAAPEAQIQYKAQGVVDAHVRLRDRARAGAGRAREGADPFRYQFHWRLVRDDPGVLRRRLAAQYRSRCTARSAGLFGGIRLRHHYRGRHRETQNQARRRGRHGHRDGGQDRLALSAGAREAKPLPDAHQVHGAVGRVEAALWQHLRAQAARRARDRQHPLYSRMRSA